MSLVFLFKDCFFSLHISISAILDLVIKKSTVLLFNAPLKFKLSFFSHHFDRQIVADVRRSHIQCI